MHTQILIRTVYTDVVVLAIANAYKLGIEELWVLFGKEKKLCYLAVHDMTAALGPYKCLALPMFQAFTAYDTVSSFRGRGTKTAWNIWKVSGKGSGQQWLPFLTLETQIAWPFKLTV